MEEIVKDWVVSNYDLAASVKFHELEITESVFSPFDKEQAAILRRAWNYLLDKKFELENQIRHNINYSLPIEYLVLEKISCKVYMNALDDKIHKIMFKPKKSIINERTNNLLQGAKNPH